MKNLRFVFLTVVLLVLVGFPAATGVAQDTDLPGSHHCTGKETVPIDIVLSLPDANLSAGAMVDLQATITALADLDDIDVRIAGDEAVELLGAATEYIGSLTRDQQVEIDIPVHYLAVDRAAVLVTASARDTKTGESISRREGVYTLSRSDRVYHGRDGFVALEHSSIRQEFDFGYITEEEYQTQIKEALRPDGHSDQVPREASAVPIGPVLPKLKAAAREGEEPVRRAPAGTAGTITVQGTVLFTDENGATHGAYGVQVEVWDKDLVIDDFLTLDVLGSDGQYSFVLDNDDGIGQNGLDIFVKFVTKNEAIQVQDGGVYIEQSSVHSNVADGAVVTENFTFGDTGDGPAGSVCVGASYIAAYVKFNLNGGAALPLIPVNWPAGGAFYDGASVNIRQGDKWDWDVLHHEYGHYVMDEFNFEDNPGGGHSSSQCAADVRPSKSEGLKLAWGESWPTYFGLSGQAELNLDLLGIPRVGDVSYQDTDDQNLSYSLEDNPEPLAGDDNERSLMRINWDLYDAAVDGNDNVTFDAKDLFDVFDADNSETLTEGWGALRASSLIPDNQTDLAIGGMCSDYGVGPVPVSPTAGTTVSPGSADFSWTGAVGCGTVAAGDEWDLVFYNPTTYALILTIPGLATTSTTLSLAQLQTLIGGSDNHEVLWAVEGYSTASPATGPYLGDNLSIFVNQPPVADAGSDVTAECSGPAGTPVMLDGTGSSDPDGDVLYYTWSPEGYFDDPSSPTPTGTFSLGMVTITLTVSDGLESDTDEVDVTVEDTTEPAMTCPADIVVECSDYCGTPADDPQLVDFFNEFSATDICDDDLVTSLDYPACFPLGDTEVTFTATDDSGNEGTCTDTVTVEDTTPPVISVELNRYVLWPPNHKMVDIVATVTVEDICDDGPEVILVDITSNEPDDDGGDGETDDDIDAEFGTEDYDFRLRAERSGKRIGRIYTITYRATDLSGNEAEDVVLVRVPHDQSGGAFAATGFNENGTGFVSGRNAFALVIPSRTDVFGVGENGQAMMIEELFDATQLDMSRTYVGNTKGVLVPDRWEELDQNGDGLMDVVVWYRIEGVKPLVENVAEGQMGEVWVSDPIDPVGLHYVSAGGIDYLVSDIFRLGQPVDLPGSGTAGVEVPEAPTYETRLFPVAPNPFTGTTTIRFTLAMDEHVTLRIYDARGSLVRTIQEGGLTAGEHRPTWNGRDNRGKQVSTGVYFVRLCAGAYEVTRKVVLSQ
jgi:hypothetical protein